MQQRPESHRRGTEQQDDVILWARRITVDPCALYLDTETTGIDYSAEIIEVSVVDADGQTVFDSLVRPVGPIPSAARRVHGISEDHVRDAPGWSAVHAELCRILEGRVVVVYNAAFDRRLITQCAQRHGLRPPPVDWQCAMLQYAALKQVPGRYPGTLRWHKLEQAAASFGASPGGHRARADALACRTVVIGMARVALASER